MAQLRTGMWVTFASASTAHALNKSTHASTATRHGIDPRTIMISPLEIYLYVSYLRALPRTLSAGYFWRLCSSLSRVAFIKSTSNRSAIRMR